jgi:ABC-2 type transport system permease protein
VTAIALDPHEVRIGAREALAQARALAGRSVRGTLRQPQVWLPGLLFPMFIAAVNTSTMGKAVQFLPGFAGVDSLLDFLLPASITQSVLFGGLTAGSDTATDIQTGFFDRLLASPVSRTSILVGRLAGASVTGAAQAVIFMLVYGAFGARRVGCPASWCSSPTPWSSRWSSAGSPPCSPCAPGRPRRCRTCSR